MGANTTLQLAVDRPESVRGIVLEDPAFFMNQVPDSPSRVDEIRRNMHAWISEMQAMPFEQVVMRCINDNPTWRAEELIAWAESKRQFGEKMEHFGPAQSNPWQELVPQLRVPTLLVVADPAKGGLVTAEAAATARALSAHVEVALIRNVGHCIRREAPLAFEKLVATYAQRIATR
jgi:pimeloyl-ACP methyl ester carboxylesterase